MIKGLDHVNLRTNQVSKLVDWYESVLGLKAGWRPDFPFDGAWLYAGDLALVHLVGVDAKTEAPSPDVQLEHAAFQASDLKTFLQKLDQMGVEYRTSELTDAKVVQVNVWDPDRNHLHIDFPMDEGA